MRTGCKSDVGLYKADFNESLFKRFQSKCGVEGDNGCIKWMGYKTSKGYGILHYNKNHKKTTAHRIAWVLKHGDIAPEMMILHKCDNPSCVNPDHLFLGTPQQNTNDMVSKKRHAWRNGQPWQKLGTSDVKRIKELRLSGKTQQFIADLLNVSRPLISLIENGKIKHTQGII